MHNAAKWRCSVCGKGVGNNQYNVLAVRNAYTRNVVVSVCPVTKSFICRGCLNSVISTGHTNIDIGTSTNLELVDKFCYLGDMLSVDGDADAAAEARIRTGWNRCLPILIYH